MAYAHTVLLNKFLLTMSNLIGLFFNGTKHFGFLVFYWLCVAGTVTTSISPKIYINFTFVQSCLDQVLPDVINALKGQLLWHHFKNLLTIL